jgi:hypothetical protein
MRTCRIRSFGTHDLEFLNYENVIRLGVQNFVLYVIRGETRNFYARGKF